MLSLVNDQLDHPAKNTDGITCELFECIFFQSQGKPLFHSTNRIAHMFDYSRGQKMTHFGIRQIHGKSLL